MQVLFPTPHRALSETSTQGRLCGGEATGSATPGPAPPQLGSVHGVDAGRSLIPVPGMTRTERAHLFVTRVSSRQGFCDWEEKESEARRV
ncbi:hypothetical protein AAFF_G00085520 [Aldrovandia affinis]|uniref:Uncharacterized protein n=1 Tax=Aldrovandia affinis TaxID=143900 RepID=A0AAD7RWY5_9TELE|nr:hypothetical protein AAFF_G00085520 [Aldrovandia affinis]